MQEEHDDVDRGVRPDNEFAANALVSGVGRLMQKMMGEIKALNAVNADLITKNRALERQVEEMQNKIDEYGESVALLEQELEVMRDEKKRLRQQMMEASALQYHGHDEEEESEPDTRPTTPVRWTRGPRVERQ